jgi:hypothetical protein
MSDMTLDSNPLHRLAAMGSKSVDKPKDPSIETAQTPPVNSDGQNSADRFEQAKKAFFSK